jgi:hypothetical protein
MLTMSHSKIPEHLQNGMVGRAALGSFSICMGVCVFLFDICEYLFSFLNKFTANVDISPGYQSRMNVPPVI